MLRQFLIGSVKKFGIEVIANSKSVASSYSNAVVCYPKIQIKKPGTTRLLENRKPQILHAAYFAPYKGQDVFLDYCSLLLKTGFEGSFVIAGDLIYDSSFHKRYKELLLKKCRLLGLDNHISWMGNCENMEDVYSKSSLLLHCTKTPEPFGRVIVEALNYGCDVICHRESGACEIVHPIFKIEESPYYPLIKDPDLCYIKASGCKIA